MTEEAIVLKKSSYEPWVTEKDGHLIYHLPVESGFASLLFKFKITPDQLAVLEADEERFYFLFALLHHRYQMLKSVLAPETDSYFDAILFGSIPDVEQVLNLADAESRGAVSNLVLRTMGSGPRTVWFGKARPQTCLQRTLTFRRTFQMMMATGESWWCGVFTVSAPSGLQSDHAL